MFALMDLKKYFLKPCRLMLACALGTCVVLQPVAHGVIPIVLTDHNRRPRSPIVERRYESGDTRKTLFDLDELDCGDIKLQLDNTACCPKWFYKELLLRICDIPSKCKDREEAEKVFRGGVRLGSCAPLPTEDQSIGFNILHKKGPGPSFIGLIHFVCAPPEAPGTRARIFVKRWLRPELSISEESRKEASKYVGLALANIMQFLMRNGCSFDVVMDYDFEPEQVLQDLIVAQKWLDDKRNCEWEINEFGDPKQVDIKPGDNGMVSVSYTSMGKVHKYDETAELPREKVDPLLFRENNIAKAFRFSKVL